MEAEEGWQWSWWIDGWDVEKKELVTKLEKCDEKKSWFTLPETSLELSTVKKPAQLVTSIAPSLIKTERGCKRGNDGILWG